MNRDLLPELVDELTEIIRVNGKKTNFPPWQSPSQVDGVYLFPAVNDAEALEFFFLLGALNYSYWIRQESGVTTWGVKTQSGKQLHDVFALAYCIRRSLKAGQMEFDADFYKQLDVATARRIFSSPDAACRLPMLESRVKKINELGRGLAEFSREFGRSRCFESFCRTFNNFDNFLHGLRRFFPYSFGDPFKKLGQLLYKMITDRQPENLPEGCKLEVTPDWENAVNFTDLKVLSAQPDYMLPLFALKSGLWSPAPEVIKFFSRPVELPMDHPVEQTIREKTVETVDQLVDALPEAEEYNAGRVDSVMWQTAVEGCFPASCSDCWFRQSCLGRKVEPERLDWHHHLTRTPYY